MTVAREPWRHSQLDELARRALASPEPVVVTGPPGAGKTTLLHALADELRHRGQPVFVLDLFGAASTCEHLLLAAARALRPQLPTISRRLEAAATGGRVAAAEGVRILFDTWHEADMALLLDEPTEIRSLAYYPGLRDVATTFGAALEGRRAPTVLASSYSFATRRLWPACEPFALGPLSQSDAPSVDPDVLRVAFGWPRYVALLGGYGQLRERWTGAMDQGGALEAACRATYEALLLRSRGYGITKALLAVLADHEPLTLTTAVEHLGRKAGATRDYLEWLLLVDAVQVHTRRYFFADGLVRLWVRLHAQGTRPTAADLDAAFDDALRSDERAALIAERRSATRRPQAAPEPPPEPETPLPRRRPDTLVEID